MNRDSHGSHDEARDSVRTSSLESRIEEEIDEIAHYARRVPRAWFFGALVVIGILLTFASVIMHIAPWWMSAGLFAVLVALLAAAIWQEHDVWARRLALTTISVLTLFLVVSITYLVHALFHENISAVALFRDALLLWVTNIFVFAVWYWEIDRGGPIRRHRGTPEPPDLLFPQMMADVPDWKGWQPTFIDYLYLAFNTNTAFSPTDTAVLSRRMKLLMMTQSALALVVVAVVAGRAINIG
ncbi:DUF1345 domain-containing protein [Alicyclobacillus sendaiensis]|uniref:DUF1345 domain-containing protein n=1 Tax=Alicyclobacillus sendaiensis PA2 TaxID=3029425 RepID=A0ABT6XY92_ALISE|nr:DUF1345 domain-containing protein [Alicyclobacillus sendaiensis]MDI9260052.1 DUF1345 domain-containing protein [Alicyclobacillus sendaiensis PA2]